MAKVRFPNFVTKVKDKNKKKQHFPKRIGRAEDVFEGESF